MSSRRLLWGRGMIDAIAQAQGEFFNLLLSGTSGEIELRRLRFDTAQERYTQPESIVSRDLKTLLAFSTNGGGDIFHGINLRKSGVINAKKSDIAELVTVAIDVDFKSTSKASFERTLLNFQHKPSVIVDSGNGRHCYWLLKSPIVADDQSRELAEGIAKGIARRMGGDSTHDISRILRTPGRENSKYIHRPICKVISDDGPRYDIAELKSYFEKPSASGAKATLGDIPDELPEKFQTLLSKHRVIASTWRGERPDLNDQSGSGYDMAMAGLLVHKGFTDTEIAGILRRMPSGKGGNSSEAYLSHTIGKARQSGNKETGATNQQAKAPLIEILENIEVEEIDYLWNKRIPRGKLTLFDGDPGIGKSYTALAVAAALSRGAALPFDKEPEAPLRSLIISAEDGAGDTIKPRLHNLNADMSLIAVPHRERGFTPSNISADVIESLLKEWPAALVVIDPIIAFANRRNTDKASDVRDLLGPLAIVAEKHKAAIVLIRHLNKSTQSKALYRGQGSIDFAAVCRSAFIFAQDADNPERRLMAHAKGSISGLQPTIEFYIDKDGGFRWGGESSESADEALDTGEPRRGREPEQLEAAKKFLADMLADGTQASNIVKERAAKTGVAWRTVWRAKEALGIKASKSRETGEWFWRL